nr:FKBP-type peptidyl-prolyl cis-trans isomerase [Microbacterium ulmi]
MVGCAATGPQACERQTESAPAVMDLISVSGDDSSAPKVEIPAPLRTDDGGFRDVVTGEGTPITSPSQLVVLDVTIVDGATGETVITTPYDGDLSRAFALSRWSQGFPTFEAALQCATEGSRVAIALAPGDIEQETAAGLGIGEKDSAVAVVDVRKVFLSRAQGALQFNSGNGLPAVVRAPDGHPGVTIPDAAPPTETVVQTLIKGDGAVVTADAPVRVHYTGLTWADKSVFQSTWDADPASVALDSVVPGFAQAVKGQTVGSQVMVVIPPKDGYGDQAQGSIPANSTLVFVIDILGIDAPAAQ